MKKLLLAFALSTASIVSAEVIQLSPMHEEDPHFIHYRCLMIDGSIHSIENVLEKLKCGEVDKDIAVSVIEEHVKSIKYNLGYPLHLENER